MEDKKRMCKVIIVCGRKALVLKRSRWVIYHPHRWDVPGGAADLGETNEDAAIRETIEEAGIEIEKKNLRMIDHQSKKRDGKPAERWCFSYEVDAQFKPKLSFEHSEYAWIGIDELEAINLPNFYKDCIVKSLDRALAI